MSHHLAQINVGRLRAPIDDPLIRDFADGLDLINALAEASPGFVWRLQTDDGNATGIRISDDELEVVNVSVWESIDALDHFVYRTGHIDFLRRRSEWFERFSASYLALWWIPAGHEPTAEEGMERLAILDAEGPTPEAFTLRKRFDPPQA